MNEEESYKQLQSIFSEEMIEKKITATISRMKNLINRETAIYIILKENNFDFDNNSFDVKFILKRNTELENNIKQLREKLYELKKQILSMNECLNSILE
jgi:hypothetical protein